MSAPVVPRTAKSVCDKSLTFNLIARSATVKAPSAFKSTYKVLSVVSKTAVALPAASVVKAVP